MKLLVGLGNPGSAYAATRHNAGFWWIDQLAQQLKLTLTRERACRGLVGLATAAYDGQTHTFWLLQPQTWMNLSGQSVGALARFYKIAPADVLVVHDELDLPAGQIKLKFGGGHAGHNGLRDIHAALGSGEYWRLRIGIGHPGIRSEVVNWVLQKPPSEHRAAIDMAIARSLEALPQLLRKDTAAATRLMHVQPPAQRVRTT